MEKGFIRRGKFKAINVQGLNRFSKLLGFKKQHMKWEDFFKVSKELNDFPDKYKGGYGLIELARKMNITTLTTIFSAFTEEARRRRWRSIILTLNDYDCLKTELDAQQSSNEYNGLIGLIKLAKKTSINPNGIYSAFGGRGNKYSWPSISLTLQEIEKVEKKLKDPSNLRGYKIAEGVDSLAKEMGFNPDKKNSLRVLLASDYFSRAMIAEQKRNTGGIDLTSSNINLQTKSTNDQIVFNLNPAMLAEFKDIPGFVPVIQGYEPLISLKEFLEQSM